MNDRKDTAVEALLEQPIAQGQNDIAGVFARTFELAMELERERFLGAGHCQRTPERRGYANGAKPKRVDTPAGSVNVQIPKTAGPGDAPVYPQSLERGRRSVRAVMLAVAEMYIKGVSTRDVKAVIPARFSLPPAPPRGAVSGESRLRRAGIMAEFGVEGLSSSQVGRAAKLLDDGLQAWRDRPLGEIRYLLLDARYEKMRPGGIVRAVAVLSAIGIGPDARRGILGVSVALSEAEVQWRGFLDGRVTRGLRGATCVVPDDHAGLRAARRAVPGGAAWRRGQFHPARNAIHHAPDADMRKRVGRRLKAIRAPDGPAKAGAVRADLVARDRDSAPQAGRLARAKRARGARRLHSARASPQAPAHVQPDRALGPAGARAQNRQDQGLSRRGRPAAPRQRRPRRDR